MNPISNRLVWLYGSLAGLLGPAAGYVTGTADYEGKTILHILAALVLSALLGGAVAFFMAEGKLQHIFTYGITAPFIITSLIAGAQKNNKIENQKETIKDQGAKIADISTKNGHREDELSKLLNQIKPFQESALGSSSDDVAR